jgi:lysophospholipase L1-like esterase
LSLLGLALLLAANDLLVPGFPAARGIPRPDLVAMALVLAIAATALAPAVRATLAQGDLHRRVVRSLRRTATTGTALALSLVAAEAATRWLYRDITTTADDRGFFTRRWMRQNPARDNSYGFREREFSPAKPPGRVRIVVVGDSFTYGNGLKVEQRFSNLLQDALPPGFEVLNFGMPGHNTPDHVVTIRRTVARIHADFVLVQWFVNDVEGDDSTGRPAYQPLLPFPELSAWLYDRSALYTVASIKWTAWQASRPGRGYEDYMRARFGDPRSKAARQDVQAMEDLAAECRRDGLPLAFVLFPDSGYDLGDSYPFAFLHDRAMSFCAAQGFACLDLRRDFAAVEDRRSLWVNQLDHHPSAKANRIAADRIMAVFRPVWTALRRHS